MVLMVLEPSLDLSSSQASAGQAAVPRYFYDFFSPYLSISDQEPGIS